MKHVVYSGLETGSESSVEGHERKVSGWRRVGLLNGSMVENGYVNGKRLWADSARRLSRN